MKKLLVLMMCFQLILSPVAFAEGAPSASTYEQGSQNRGGYDYYAKAILALGTSIIGANIITQCSFGFKVPSIAIYMAGSVINIAAELAGAKAQNDFHNQKMDELKLVKENMAREGGQMQRAALVKQKEDQEHTKKFINDRLIWNGAVLAAYLTATGFAISEEITALAAGVTAGAGSCAVTAAALAAPCTVGYAACYAGHLAGCLGLMNTGVISQHAGFMNPGVVPTALATCVGPYAPGCLANTNAYTAIAWANCMPLSMGGGFLGAAMVTGIVAAYTMGIKKTSDSKVANYGAMLSMLLMMLVPSLQRLVVPAYNFPVQRAITFGASSVLAGAIEVGLFQRKAIAQDNIEKLEEAIAQFKLQDDGLDLGNTDPAAGGDGQDIDPSKKKYALKNLQKPIAVKNCMNSKAEYSSAACSNPIKIAKPKFDVATGVQTLNQAGMMANELANAITSGDMESANVLAGKLGSQAARLKEINAELTKKLNAEYKKQKRKPLDFDGEVKKQVASMQASFNSAAASKGFGPANISGEATLGETKPEETTPAATPIAAEAPVVEMPEVDLSDVEEPAAEPAEVKAATLAESLDQYETNESDISKDTSVSIFKQVSNRYFLNYTKIFEKKQIDPPLAEPAKAP